MGTITSLLLLLASTLLTRSPIKAAACLHTARSLGCVVSVYLTAACNSTLANPMGCFHDMGHLHVIGTSPHATLLLLAKLRMRLMRHTNAVVLHPHVLAARPDSTQCTQPGRHLIQHM